MVDGRTFTTSFVIHIAQHVVPSPFDPACIHIQLYSYSVLGSGWKMYWPFSGASECFTLFIGSLSLRETRGKRRPGPGERFSPLWGVPWRFHLPLRTGHVLGFGG